MSLCKVSEGPGELESPTDESRFGEESGARRPLGAKGLLMAVHPNRTWLIEDCEAAVWNAERLEKESRNITFMCLFMASSSP